MLGGGALGEHAIGEIGLNNVKQAVKLSSEIPESAKEEFENFIEETFLDKMWSTVEELIQVSPPPELLEYWDIFLTILKALLSP